MRSSENARERVAVHNMQDEQILTTKSDIESQKESLVEQLGEWLRGCRPAQRWAILLSATFAALLLDVGTYQQQLSMAALYLAL